MCTYMSTVSNGTHVYVRVYCIQWNTCVHTCLPYPLKHMRRYVPTASNGTHVYIRVYHILYIHCTQYTQACYKILYVWKGEVGERGGERRGKEMGSQRGGGGEGRRGRGEG